MLRDGIERTLIDEYSEDGYLFPAYGTYCFANVPHTVSSLLGVSTGHPLPPDVFEGLSTDQGTVLVLLIDGLGLKQWKRDRAHHEFIETVTIQGRVTPLTTVYPSETTAAMTTFHTGRLPAEHGGIGWNIYEPETGESFEALNFAKKDGTSPAMDFGEVFNARSIYHTLAPEGIDVHHVTAYPRDLRGVTSHGFEGLDELAGTLSETLRAADPPAYVFAYIGAIDAVSHDHGTESVQYQETLSRVFGSVEAAIGRLDSETAARTLLLVTADHGHVDTEPERNLNLGDIDGLEPRLASDGTGDPIRYAGNPRNVHLHLQPGTADEVRAMLQSAFDARVFEREDVIERELFGAPPSETFRRRVGDLVVVPRDRSVWWGDDEPEELAYVGMHGGLHPDEMLVPFGVAPLVDVR